MDRGGLHCLAHIRWCQGRWEGGFHSFKCSFEERIVVSCAQAHSFSLYLTAVSVERALHVPHWFSVLSVLQSTFPFVTKLVAFDSNVNFDVLVHLSAILEVRSDKIDAVRGRRRGGRRSRRRHQCSKLGRGRCCCNTRRSKLVKGGN